MALQRADLRVTVANSGTVGNTKLYMRGRISVCIVDAPNSGSTYKIEIIDELNNLYKEIANTQTANQRNTTQLSHGIANSDGVDVYSRYEAKDINDDEDEAWFIRITNGSSVTGDQVYRVRLLYWD